jgi:hypothetical protein
LFGSFAAILVSEYFINKGRLVFYFLMVTGVSHNAKGATGDGDRSEYGKPLKRCPPQQVDVTEDQVVPVPNRLRFLRPIV